MLDHQYLLHGLDALCRAHETDYFADGHRGGAIVSACYLCQERGIDASVQELLRQGIDENWASTPLCAPFASESADATLLENLTTAMQANLQGLRQAGHNVILPTLALKAFASIPAAITAARVSGVGRLIESFKVDDFAAADSNGIPPIRDAAAFANFILDEFVACTQRFEGRGQGWSGHLLTLSRALMDLWDMGYEDLSLRAVDESLPFYLGRIRLGPLDTDAVRDEQAPIEHFPTELEYWQARGRDWGLGHVLKYPYGFYGLYDRAGDEPVKQQALEVAFRVL